MKIAFTICTNNYISLGRALGRSLQRSGNDFHFVIGLADKWNDELNDYYKDFEVIPCTQAGAPDLEEMSQRYTIVELSCALKPVFHKHLLEKYPDAEYVTYLDSDLFAYGPMHELDEVHKQYDIILTPHILQPQPFDGKHPNEIAYLATGTFNAGFLSLKRSDNTLRMLDWWAERVRYYGFYDFKRGLFVDQKWLNLVPVFFDSTTVLRHYGYNVAYWNMHERTISNENGRWMINKTFPLIFMHYSSVNLKEGILFFKQQNRYTDQAQPLYKQLFMEYRDLVYQDGYEYTSRFECYYAKRYQEHQTQKLKKSLKGRIKLFLRKNISAARRESLKRKLKSLTGD